MCERTSEFPNKLLAVYSLVHGKLHKKRCIPHESSSGYALLTSSVQDSAIKATQQPLSEIKRIGTKN